MRWAACLLSVTAFAQTGIDGTVFDTVAHAPIPGATVKLHRGDESPQSTASDIQGKFRFDAIPAGEYRVTISHPAHMPLDRRHSARPFLLSATNPEVRLRAELVPFARISGRVLSPTNQPIAGIPVGLRRIWDGHWIMTTWTAKDGTFEFNTLEPATWILAALPLMRIQTRTPEKDPKPIAPPADQEGQRVGLVHDVLSVHHRFRRRRTHRPPPRHATHRLRHQAPHNTRPPRLGRRPRRRRQARSQSLSLTRRPLRQRHPRRTDLLERDLPFVFDAIPDGEWRLFAQAKRLDQTHKGYINLHVSRRDTEGWKCASLRHSR